MMNKYFSLFAIILVFLSNTIFAQDGDTTQKVIQTHFLKDIIITAQFAPKPQKDAIYNVKVFNQETIKNKAANNLKELLQQELNLNLNQAPFFGASAEIQGIAKENIKILIDGVPVVGRLNGIINLNQINLDNIERVEIIEGPVSVFYGTDAIGGAINLITKQAQEEKLTGGISAYYETINATNFTGDMSYKKGSNSIRLNAGYYQFDGLSTNNDIERNLNWEKRNQGFAALQFLHEFQDLKLRYDSRFSREGLFSKGTPITRRGTTKITDTDYFTRRIDNTLNLQGSIFGNKFIDATLSYLDYQRFHDSYNIDPSSFGETLIDTDHRDDNIVKFNLAKAKIQVGKSDKEASLNYALGTDVNIETSESQRILDGKQSINTIAFYSSLNWKLTENFEVQPGGRYTYNSVYGSLFSPAFLSKLKLGKQSNLRFSYARGFRAPSLKELYLDFHISAGPATFVISGNETLEVEKSHSFSLAHSLNIDKVKLETSLFYNEIDNLIALSEMEDNKRHYININQFKSKGAKVNLTLRPSDKFSIKTGFLLIGRYNEYSEDFVTDEFLYSPEFNTSLTWSLDNLVNVNLFYKFTGEREGFYLDSTTQAPAKTTREGFSNLDLTLSKSIIKNKVNFSLGVKNIFDVKDIQTTNFAGDSHSRDMQLWGRSFFFKTSVNF